MLLTFWTMVQAVPSSKMLVEVYSGWLLCRTAAGHFILTSSGSSSLWDNSKSKQKCFFFWGFLVKFVHISLCFGILFGKKAVLVYNFSLGTKHWTLDEVVNLSEREACDFLVSGSLTIDSTISAMTWLESLPPLIIIIGAVGAMGSLQGFVHRQFNKGKVSVPSDILQCQTAAYEGINFGCSEKKLTFCAANVS